MHLPDNAVFIVYILGSAPELAFILNAPARDGEGERERERAVSVYFTLCRADGRTGLFFAIL